MDWLSFLGLRACAVRWRANMMEGVIAVEDRLGLARLEWLDQKRRLQQLLVLAVAVAGLTVVALLSVSAAVMVQFWDTPHRALVAWIMAAVWLIVWLFALWKLLLLLRSAGNGFALTRRELAQDWNALKEHL